MADPLNLSKLTELPPVRCYECGNLIGQSYDVYILMIKTFAELVPQFHDEISPQNFQNAWNSKREQHLSIVRQVRARAIHSLNITYNDDIWRTINELSKIYKNVLNRAHTRSMLAQKSLITLREKYLRDNNKPINAENANIVNFDDASIFEEIVRMRGTPKQISDIGFLNLSITERLERVRYPSEQNDTKWADLFREKIGITDIADREIRDSLTSVLNIQKLTVLPEATFSDSQWDRLRSTSKRENELSQYGGVSMDLLGYTRSCCRQNLAQPIILPMEAELETTEIQNIERMDPKTLIYSRFTSPLDMPTTESERLFIEGKITSNEAFLERNTRKALSIKSGYSANIISPINAMIGGNIGVKFEIPTQTSAGMGYGGIITQTPNDQLAYNPSDSAVGHSVSSSLLAEPTAPYQMKLPVATMQTSPALGMASSPSGAKEPAALPAPTFGGVSINTGSAASLPAPTFGGEPISITTAQISTPVNIGIIPSFRKDKQRNERQPRSQKQPGGLNIPLEEIPGDLKVYPAI